MFLLVKPAANVMNLFFPVVSRLIIWHMVVRAVMIWLRMISSIVCMGGVFRVVGA